MMSRSYSPCPFGGGSGKSSAALWRMPADNTAGPRPRLGGLDSLDAALTSDFVAFSKPLPSDFSLSCGPDSGREGAAVVRGRWTMLRLSLICMLKLGCSAPLVWPRPLKRWRASGGGRWRDGGRIGCSHCLSSSLSSPPSASEPLPCAPVSPGPNIGRALCVFRLPPRLDRRSLWLLNLKPSLRRELRRPLLGAWCHTLSDLPLPEGRRVDSSLRG
mmetsp:Transcript_23123/g.64246  ORF Transcript_23123/g.64246 Transcript_23123/m.64246 type:complete len:216 (-) Transcript_23123:2095-2742(-)